MNMEDQIDSGKSGKSKRVRYALIALATVAIAIVLIFWLGRREKSVPVQNSAGTTKQMDASDTTEMVSLSNAAMVHSGIGVVPLEMREFASELSTVGVIEIPEPAQRTIAARARGRIERMFVSATGTYVRKGESLFEFYSPDILSAEKDYLSAYEMNEMANSTTTEDPSMQEHSNKGLVEAGQKRLELYGLTADQIHKIIEDGEVKTTITVNAPMDGLILQKLSQEGAYVDEGTNIFQLADLSSVWAEVNVPESYIRFIRLGQSIPIHTEAYPTEHFVGNVILISPIEDQTSRTIRVRLSLRNPGYKLRPQMTFSATLSSDMGRSLAVPQSAIVRMGTGDYVWVVDSGNMFTRHTVTLGVLSPDNYYQVVSGLTLGDRVAANGSFLVDAEHELSKSNPMAGMDMGEKGNANAGEGTGIVRSISTEQQTITLDHGTIPGVMPPMTMGYKVSEPGFLQSVHLNDHVRFTLTRSPNGEYIITAIEKQ